ncbi:hypothetical protein [Georgenia thermotolerans]|uniref:Uncharacterized protein n=1 Tax=Georgenia thermotolerans TaxID=527326 RepID=A0A7J5URD4_9MICO|nr:hypothetical protein [Georgenia thermotolerans]KAE8764780.1 hypothetical protein GB883_07350 [Georgenia thermotolerans]
MDVRAIFELPVPIWVTRETLGASYPTGYGALQFDIVMPHDHPPVGAPPAVPGIEMSTLSGELVVWAQEYGAFIPESRRPATAVHRVGVAVVKGPTYDHRSWFTPDHQLAESIDGWFDNVRTWVEVVTGQDLDPRHRVYDAEVVGAGLTFIEPPHEGALGLVAATPRVTPLHRSEWAEILNYVQQGTEPPLEEVLSRDARAAQRRNANRRAIIDAATALEIAIGRHVREHEADLPEVQRRRLNTRSALGDYISIAKESGLELAVPIAQLRRLNRLRNDAAHRAATASNWEAGEAVQVMIEFLGAHGTYRRTGEGEPDGGEFVVAEPESS